MQSSIVFATKSMGDMRHQFLLSQVNPVVSLVLTCNISGHAGCEAKLAAIQESLERNVGTRHKTSSHQLRYFQHRICSVEPAWIGVSQGSGNMYCPNKDDGKLTEME